MARAFQRPESPYWYAEWREPNRKPRKGGFATEGAALAYAARQEAISGAVTEHLTFAQYAERWLRDYAESRAPLTAQGYAGNLDRYILPFLGTKRLAAITPYDVVQLEATLRRSGGVASGRRACAPLGEATILKVHRQLTLMLRHARAWGLLATDPMVRTDAPRPRRVESAWHGAEALRAVLQAAEGTPAHALVALAVYAGLSKGELRGVQWGDLRGDLLTLRRTRVYVNGRGDVEQPMKRDRRARTLILVPEALEALGPRGNPDGWIVGLTLAGITYWMRKVRKAAGLDGGKLHIFRHSFATAGLQGGSTVAEMSAALGHANPAITLGIYTHVDPARTRDVVGRVADNLRENAHPAPTPLRSVPETG